MLQTIATTVFALIGPLITVGLIVMLSLLTYKLIFKKISSKKQVVIVAITISLVLIATGVLGYFYLTEVQLSWWFVIVYYAALILIGCFTAKLSEKSVK